MGAAAAKHIIDGQQAGFLLQIKATMSQGNK
jgi:hypothetical protein